MTVVPAPPHVPVVELRPPEIKGGLPVVMTSHFWVQWFESLRREQEAASAGEANTASNVGAGAGVFKQKTGAELEFRSVVGRTGLSSVQNLDDVALDHDAHTGDATGATELTIAANAVSNDKAAQMPQATVKGRADGAGTGDQTDLTATQLVEIVKTADGAGSGLDADLIHGEEPVSLWEQLKAQHIMSGGGLVSYLSGKLKWDGSFMIRAGGRGTHFSTDGYFEIIMPTSGNLTGVGGAATGMWTADGTALGSNLAIYYILPIGSDHTSVAANFRAVALSADVEIPASWVLIASSNTDDFGALRLGGGGYLNPEESRKPSKPAYMSGPTVRGHPDGASASPPVDLTAQEVVGVINSIGPTNTLIARSATATQRGTAELATIAEVDAGTDTDRTITPAGLAGSALQVKVNGIEVGANNYSHPNHTGDVTSVGDGAQTIVAAAVTLAMMANLAAGTIIGRTAAGAGVPTALTAQGVIDIINALSPTNNLIARSATAAQRGTAELATIAEVDAGTDTDRTITPAGLAGSVWTGGLQWVIKDIGDWDMDADGSVVVAHDLGGSVFKNVRSIIAVVRNDADTNAYEPFRVDGYWTLGSTNVTLFREAGGFFDGTDFDSTSFNRGWVTIGYV